MKNGAFAGSVHGTSQPQIRWPKKPSAPQRAWPIPWAARCLRRG